MFLRPPSGLDSTRDSPGLNSVHNPERKLGRRTTLGKKKRTEEKESHGSGRAQDASPFGCRERHAMAIACGTDAPPAGYAIPDAMVHQDALRVQTSGRRDMHDITAQAAETVVRSGIRTGTADAFRVGSTGRNAPCLCRPRWHSRSRQPPGPIVGPRDGGLVGIP